jgi:hypothetical protein
MVSVRKPTTAETFTPAFPGTSFCEYPVFWQVGFAARTTAATTCAPSGGRGADLAIFAGVWTTVLPSVALERMTIGVSRRAEDYRAQAAQCKEAAKQARDLEVKRQYEELTHQWLEMANQAERQNW